MNVDPGSAQALKKVEAGGVGQHDVEQDCVGHEVGDRSHGLEAVRSGLDFEADESERGLEHVEDRLFVIDDENTGFIGHGDCGF